MRCVSVHVARADLQSDMLACIRCADLHRACARLQSGCAALHVPQHASKRHVRPCRGMCWLAFATCMKARGAYRLAERYAGLHTGVKTCTGLCTLAERL